MVTGGQRNNSRVVGFFFPRISRVVGGQQGNIKRGHPQTGLIRSGWPTPHKPSPYLGQIRIVDASGHARAPHVLGVRVKARNAAEAESCLTVSDKASDAKAAEDARPTSGRSGKPGAPWMNFRHRSSF